MPKSVAKKIPQKIIHSCTSMSFSGLERYVLDFAVWQYMQGDDVELFCRENSELEKRAKEKGLPVWTIGERDKKGPFLWAKMASDWSTRFRAATAANSEIVLHMHAGGEPWFHLPWLMARSRVLKKTILQYHLWINHKKKDPLHAAVFSGIDEIWCSSESARAHLSSLLPVGQKVMRVIPYGRDLPQLQKIDSAAMRVKIRKELSIPESAPVAVCVTRIEPIKGVGELFDGFVEIANRVPKAFLVIVGDVSPNNREAEEFASELHKKFDALSDTVKKRIKFTGYRSDSLDVVAACDFYVLPTYEECMSLAMLDAINLGLPILGTNSGGTPSVARPDETGWLVRPRDATELGMMLKKVFDLMDSAPEEFKAVSANARKLGLEFDQETIFKRIRTFYSE